MMGKRIRERRKSKGLTMKELGAKLNLAESTIAGYEAGYREPSASMLEKIAEVLDTSTDYLLGRTDDPTPNISKKDDLSDLSPEDRAILEKIKNDPDLDLFFKDFASAPAEHQRDLIKIWKALHGKEK